jgi:uncharacterized membrane protein (DUF373 family)
MMRLKDEVAEERTQFSALRFYDKFEHIVVLALTAIIAVIVVAALWNLAVKVLFGLILPGNFDPTDYGVFQALFGTIFTVIIALEFKKTLTVVTDRRSNIVQVRAVLLLALLAVVRKIIIIDMSSTDSLHLISLATAILALGAAYWLVRDSDRRSAMSLAERSGT